MMRNKQIVGVTLMIILGLTALVVIEESGITGFATNIPPSPDRIKIAFISLFVIISLMIGIYRWFKE